MTKRKIKRVVGEKKGSTRRSGTQPSRRGLQCTRGQRIRRDCSLLIRLSLVATTAQIQAYIDFLQQYNLLPARFAEIGACTPHAPYELL